VASGRAILNSDRVVYFEDCFIQLKVSFFTDVFKIMTLLLRLPHSLLLHHSTTGDEINTSFALGDNLKQFLIAMEGVMLQI
jgi:hypothetical protein